jgi:hypothetical protein
MKYRIQIYVIGFLFNYKMKEIVVLFFALSGIFKGLAQSPADSIASIKGAKTIAPATQKMITDSLSTKEKATLKLFPNPVKNRAEVEVRGFEPGNVHLLITDINGKTVRDDQRLLTSGNENIVLMFSLQPGIYFIAVKQNNTLLKKKMVVQ